MNATNPEPFPLAAAVANLQCVLDELLAIPGQPSPVIAGDPEYIAAVLIDAVSGIVLSVSDLVHAFATVNPALACGPAAQTGPGPGREHRPAHRVELRFDQGGQRITTVGP